MSEATTDNTIAPVSVVTVNTLKASDYAAWQRLADGYNRFYERELPEASFEKTWARLLEGDGIHGFAAWMDGKLLGITHYLYQPSV